jgi:hypothetical protein
MLASFTRERASTRNNKVKASPTAIWKSALSYLAGSQLIEADGMGTERLIRANLKFRKSLYNFHAVAELVTLAAAIGLRVEIVFRYFPCVG